MKIGLIDVDGHNGFPNLALMKISAYHKSKGDTVGWYTNSWLDGHVDKAYMAKVFTFEKDFQSFVDADEIVKGGTGYGLFEDLAPEIDAMFPDYSIYPNFKSAIGFITRGCIRNCPWCVVPRKEGMIRPYSDWRSIRREDSDELVLLDNNVLASDYGIAQMESMIGAGVKVDFNQGMDARLVTPEIAKIISRLKWIRYIRFSCDTKQALAPVCEATKLLLEAGVAKSRLWSYLLVQDIGDAMFRFKLLREIGYEVFAQPYRAYDQTEPPADQQAFARWINGYFYKACSWEDYKYNPSNY